MTGESEATDTETSVRLATTEDLPPVMNVLDGSLLDVAATEVRDRIRTDRVLVATDGKPLRGVLVLSGAQAADPGSGTSPGTKPDPDLGSGVESMVEIEAIAVRRRYRNRGIASALVERARRETNGPLVAEFDDRVRPFYRSLGFDVYPTDDSRFRGCDTRR